MIPICTEAEGARPGVQIIVPTLKRPNFLRRCLAAIQAQTIEVERVLVGIKPDDGQSLAVVDEFVDRLPVQSVEAKGIGVIGSMSSCVKLASEEYIGLVDDDVELPPHWLETMLSHLAENPDVMAAGGRDFLQDYPAMRRTEARVADVGQFHWYGRITGNHHRGGGKPRKVEILRGSNCLFRGEFLRGVGFEQALLGEGAQVNWELALAFHAMHRKCHFFYDPNVEIIHHTAPRFDQDALHRGGFDSRATFNNAFNETFLVARYAPGLRKWTALAYQGAIGSSLAPGFLHFLRQVTTREARAIARLKATFQGRSAALVETAKQSSAGAAFECGFWR
jgi:GT2 family glycosyltransferase